MDELEGALLRQAIRLLPTLSDDELTARLNRRNRPLLHRPPRAWCLAIRATDTRITLASAIIVPEDAIDPTNLDHPGRLLPHQVTVDAPLCRQLCRPVHLQPPGQPLHEVAALLGVHPNVIRTLRLRGVLRTHHVKGLGHRPGPPTPMLYTDQPLDPASHLRATADPCWGWTGEHLAHRIPDDLQQTLTRVPIYAEHHPHLYNEDGPPVPKRNRDRLPPPAPDNVWYKWDGDTYIGDRSSQGARKSQAPGLHPGVPPRCRKPRPSRSTGSLFFHGYRWLCPGCQRRATLLFYPLPPLALPVHDLLEKRLRHHPLARTLAPMPTPLPCFACHACHQVQFFSRRNDSAWNHLIAHLSAGLLYGHEVPKPKGYHDTRPSPRRPRQLAHPINRAPSKQREEVLTRWLAGMESPEIAKDLGLWREAVDHHLRHLCKQHHAPHKIALAKLLARKTPLLAERILPLARAGMPPKQIATQLGADINRVTGTLRILKRDGLLNAPPAQVESRVVSTRF